MIPKEKLLKQYLQLGVIDKMASIFDQIDLPESWICIQKTVFRFFKST